VVENADGSATITCADGTSATVGDPADEELCGPVVQGIVTIESSLDVEALARTCEVDGVIIVKPGLTAVSLPALTTAGNIIVEQQATLVLLDLPALVAVGGNLTANNVSRMSVPQLSSVAGNFTFIGGDTPLLLPSLETVGGSFEVEDNDDFTELALPLLQSVGGDLIIERNAALTAVVLPNPRSVTGELSLNENSDLSSASLPALRDVGNDVRVNDTPLATLQLPQLLTAGAISVSVTQLNALSLPLLTHADQIGGSDNIALTSVDFPRLTTSSIVLVRNHALTSLSLPALTLCRRNLFINDNEGLTFFEAPLLTTVEDLLVVSANPVMERLSLPALAAVGGSITIRSNDALSNCTGALIEPVGDCAN